MVNRKYGFHSGIVHARSIEVEGDFTISGDIVFGGVSAGAIAVTGGIDLSGTTSAIGIDMGGIYSTAAINIDGTQAIGLLIGSACTTTAINVSVAQTDETVLARAAVFQHGSYDAAIAYGTQANHLVLKSTNITAGTGAYYVFGDINRITTSATSTGYMNPSYAYLSVGHNLVNGWASRGRLAITATCQVGEMSGLLGTLEVTGTTALTGVGGVNTAVLASAILDLDIATTATVAQEVTCLEVRPHIRANIEGSSAGIRINVNCSSANYLDYGLDIRSMSSNQAGAIRVFFTGASASLPAAIILEGQDSSTSVITSGIKMRGSATYFADFSSSTDAKPFTKTTSEKTGNVVGLLAVKDQDGSTAYINCYA